MNERGKAMRWGAAVLIALGVMSAAACAGPPSSGPVQTTKLGQSDNAVFISSVEPAKGMPPKTVVTNFLQAMTGDDRDPTFHVAQEYLTGDAAKTWIKPGRRTWIGGTHIVQSPSGTPDVTPSNPVADNVPVNTVVQVEVRDKLVGSLDYLGFYSVNKDPSLDDHYSFLVKKTADGVWQITNPPDFRMLTQLSFRRAYPNPLPVYLPTDSSWVPGKVDQVYLTQTGYIGYTYDALAEAAITGRVDQAPSEDPLASRVNVDPAGTAEVVLKRAPQDYSATRKAIEMTFSAAAALPQLVSAAPQLKTFTVRFPGCSPAVCDASQVSSPLSVLVPQAYWVCYKDEKPQIVFKQISGTTCPVPDPKQVVDVHYDQLVSGAPIAVKQLPAEAVSGKSSLSPSAVVAAVVPTANGAGENVVVTSERSATGAGVIWYQADGKTSVSDLAWDPDGSLWVVDNGNLYHVPEPTPGGKKPERISAPGWGNVARFKPSPDGSRDVLVAQNGSTTAAAVVDVEASDDHMMRLTTLTPLLSDQQVVTDAAWADGRTVVLLAASTSSSAQQAPPQKLFKVYADGSQEPVVDDGDAQPTATRFGAAFADTSNTLWVISNVPGESAPKSSVYIKSRPSLEDTESGDMPVLAIRSSN